jgi:hypothetical protein
MRFRFALALVLLAAPAVAIAAAKYQRPGFQLPADRKAEVLVAYPEHFIGSLDSRGEAVANPEWTAAAWANMREALLSGPVGKAVTLRFMPEEGAASPVMVEAREAFKWRTTEVILGGPQGSKWGDKVKRGQYAYTIGTDIAARLRQEFGPADYALFFTMHDAYATPGKKIGDMLGAMAVGVVGGSGAAATARDLPPHFGNAMLVDLSDGSVVWFHGDGAFGGDPRDKAGAIKRIGQATTGFPGTSRTR